MLLVVDNKKKWVLKSKVETEQELWYILNMYQICGGKSVFVLCPQKISGHKLGDVSP